MNSDADTVVVVDFGTRGMSPDEDGRAIEIGAVKPGEGELIADAILKQAPPCAGLMDRVSTGNGRRVTIGIIMCGLTGILR